MTSFRITNADYRNILQYYNKTIPETNSQLKKAAEDILAIKLCRCIKKINPILTKENEARAIGICTRTVLNNKGLSRGKFKCLKNRTVAFKKTQRLLSFGKSKTRKQMAK